MSEAIADLTELPPAALLGLRLRALDTRLPTPILHDQASLHAAHALGLDLDNPRIPRAVAAVHAVRTKTLDSIVCRFITAHPTAVVVELGCGFDPRGHRCAPPATVDWYDLDHPAVIAQRQRVLPEGGHQIGTEIGAPGWLEPIPADRPAIVVTDGLMAFVSDQVFRDITRAVTAHFPSGQLAFNAYSRFAMRNSRRMRSGPLSGGATPGEGIDDPYEPETWNAGLTLIEQRPMALEPEVAQFPPLLRAMTRLGARSKHVSRHADRVVHYSFTNPATPTPR